MSESEDREVKEGQSDVIAPKEEKEAMEAVEASPPVRASHPPCRFILPHYTSYRTR